MALNFTTTEQVTLAQGVKALIYGGSGAGKTALAATAPAPLILSAESGLLSLRKENIERLHGVGTPGINYDIPVIQIATVDDLSEAYQWLAYDAQSHSFQTIYLDSLSEIGEVVLNNAKAQVKDPRQAYGELIEKMENLIRLYRDLPGRNVVMTAKQEPFKDELSGVVKYGPSMPGSKLGNKLPYFFDEVFRMGVNKTPQGETYRFLQTDKDLQYEAKDRSGALDFQEYPSLANVFNKILGVT